MASSLYCAALTLAVFFGAFWVLHSHIFFCVGWPWVWKADEMSDRQVERVHMVLSGILAFVIGPWSTPGVIVFIINDVAELYPEIQSWQIAYIVWGVSAGFIVFIHLLWVDWYHFGDIDKSEIFWTSLLRPFGIKADTTGTESFVTVPLVSVAPAIVSGYIAYFILGVKYTLECDAKYNSFSTICESGVCCITVSSHDDLFEFIPKLGGSIVAAWGLVKGIGAFILTHGKLVEAAEIEAGGQTTTVQHSDA